MATRRRGIGDQETPTWLRRSATVATESIPRLVVTWAVTLTTGVAGLGLVAAVTGLEASVLLDPAGLVPFGVFELIWLFALRRWAQASDE